MKVIETKYKGYRFRSRTEARWAVFFDALGLNWSYEPECFDLGSAGLYLPDFHINYGDGYHAWVEVKSDLDAISASELAKIKAFGENKKLIIADGVPGPYMYLDSNMLTDSDYAPFQPKLGRFGWQFYSRTLRHWWDEHCNFFDPEGPQDEILPCLYAAIQEARSARFEHGESPL